MVACAASYCKLPVRLGGLAGPSRRPLLGELASDSLPRVLAGALIGLADRHDGSNRSRLLLGHLRSLGDDQRRSALLRGLGDHGPGRDFRTTGDRDRSAGEIVARRILPSFLPGLGRDGCSDQFLLHDHHDRVVMNPEARLALAHDIKAVRGLDGLPGQSPRLAFVVGGLREHHLVRRQIELSVQTFHHRHGRIGDVLRRRVGHLHDRPGVLPDHIRPFQEADAFHGGRAERLLAVPQRGQSENLRGRAAFGRGVLERKIRDVTHDQNPSSVRLSAFYHHRFTMSMAKDPYFEPYIQGF